MATYTQYTDSYNLPNSQVVNYCKKHISPVDDYVIVQTGRYQYLCQVDKLIGDDVEIVFTRSSSDSYYNVETVRGQLSTLTISNPYYTYSNTDNGCQLDMNFSPQIFAVVAVTSLLMFFKWVIYDVIFKK